MGQGMRRIALAVSILLIPASAVTAQAQQLVTSDGEMDVPDLIRAWRHKGPAPPNEPRQRMIVAAPIIGSNPSSGFLFGAAAQVAVFRGDPSTTRIKSGTASLSFSTKKHVLFN